MRDETENKEAGEAGKELSTHTPTPWYAVPGMRLSDDDDCWVIDSDEGSIAEMMCPADVEQANAEFIVRACNEYDALKAENERLKEVVTAMAGVVATCPACTNIGYYAVGPTDDPEQEQCEFCYTIPNSLFNVTGKARAALGEK